MTDYTYSRVAALNFTTTPVTVGRSATGSVYAVGDTTFTTPLNVTMVVGGATGTTISSDYLGFFPDFTVANRTSVVFKQAGTTFTSVLTTTDPVPGEKGDPGTPGTPGVKGDRGDLASWQATTFYALNQVITNPSGDLVKVISAHTSAGSYDPTKFDYVVPPSLTPEAISTTIDTKLETVATDPDGVIQTTIDDRLTTDIPPLVADAIASDTSYADTATAYIGAQQITSVHGASSAVALPLAWRENLQESPYETLYTDDYPGETVDTAQFAGSVPILDSGGELPADTIPEIPESKLPSNTAVIDGTKPFDQLRIGSQVLLKEVVGARGARLQYTTVGTTEDDRPYMEVNNSKVEDVYGDVIAGYQCHVTGDGTTPNNEERVYWFLEAHGLQHTFNANPDLEGCFSMGVSKRAELTERGRARTLVIDAGFRPGLAFHYTKPQIELLRNTAFVFDDHARPAIYDGVGANHSATGVGTLHGGDAINLRREGAMGIRLTNLSNTAATSPNIFMGRSRGTVLSSSDVLSGDRLGALQAGTQTTISPDYVHIPGGGAGPENLKRVTTQILSIATENFTPSTAEGSKIDVEVTPTGTATRVVGLTVDANLAAGDTSILVRVNRDGTTSQTRVLVGAPDSGGTGYRALRIAN